MLSAGDVGSRKGGKRAGHKIGTTFFLYVHGYLFCMYVYAPQACSAGGGQKRVLGLLEVELQVVVSS